MVDRGSRDDRSRVDECDVVGIVDETPCRSRRLAVKTPVVTTRDATSARSAFRVADDLAECNKSVSRCRLLAEFAQIGDDVVFSLTKSIEQMRRGRRTHDEIGSV